MTHIRIAYMPLATYPEAILNEAIGAAAALAGPIGCALGVTTFEVHLPRTSSGLGDLLIDIPGLVQANEERSRAECHRLQALVREVAASHTLNVQCAARKVAWGLELDDAAAEARYFDLSLLPWSAETTAAQDMAQAVVFGSGRPAILVPPTARPASLEHIAIAWDGSRVASRALGDALPLLAEGGRISVLTVRDEKPLSGPDLAGTLASSLQKRGFNAAPAESELGNRTIAEALQDTALSSGAQLLAMGGFGHSRIRDVVLGGATKGILTQLRIPVLLSH
ncbi:MULTISPECIES: universal stress protein [Sinorhizobium]|uniref:universal stress protein n=1 Tax=Sinorhizobium TaxID=28105 RepID=UPI000C9B5372|nr:universal stress protein [Sinorhizobium sp. M4_45]PND24113.1 universal stress protein UspA [Sinorhizobium sp. M4_45]